MTETQKALIVLEQDEVDMLIHILEDRMDQFDGINNDHVNEMEETHAKLMALIRDPGSEFRVA